jgi:uncharacterized protein YutE (UPF0331/DUF86 family)
MVNPEKVTERLEKLREYVTQLNELKTLSKNDFSKHYANSAKYLFQVAIECCLDIGNHIISSEGFRSPADYQEIFKVLEENRVIPKDFLETAVSMAKFRNRLVHLYWEVDNQKIYEYLQNNLCYFDEYINYILNYLQKATK